MEFYHGTTTAFELRVGRYLLPAAETGILREDWRKKHTDKVFTTPSLLSAEKYAKKAAAKYGGEPIVYTVKPSMPYYNINTNEYISDRARIIAVKEIIMIKPIKRSLPKSRDLIFGYSITCPYRNAS
ncbi:MAG: hypothetical protein ACI4J5_05015 [Oscillospiraceae bacterium]